MKITQTPPQGPPSYTFVLSEDEMLALRSLAFSSSATQRFAIESIYAGRYPRIGTDGKPECIADTLSSLWWETNKFLSDFKTRLKA